MRIVVLMFLVVGLGALMATPILVVPGMHTNFDVQLPDYLINNSGVTLEELDRGRPQNAFAFSDNLIGIFDSVNPGRLVVWTVRRGPDYEPKDQESYAVPVIPLIVPPPFVPPPVVPPPTCEMLGTCPQPPPQENVPEPNTSIFVFGGIALLGIGSLRRWR